MSKILYNVNVFFKRTCCITGSISTPDVSIRVLGGNHPQKGSQMHVFISHSSKDSARAEEICSLLEQGKHTCFLAPRDIRTGYEYAEEIINGIDGSGAFLLLLSQEANTSPHVLREVERAVSKKIPIIVYKLEEVTLTKSMEYFLMTHQWINTKSGSGFSEIARCIDAIEDGRNAEPHPVEVNDSETESSGISPLAVASICIVALAGIVIGLVCWMMMSADTEPSESSISPATSESSIISDESELLAKETADSSEAQAHSSEDTTVQETSETELPVTTDSTVPQPTPETSDDISLPVTSVSSSHTSAYAPEPLPETEEKTETEEADVSEMTNDAESSQPQISFEYAHLGDSITFGMYNGAPVVWRVIALSDDGTKATLISDSILTMKAYDAAEGGKYNYSNGEYYWNIPDSDIDGQLQRLIRGDNRWELSNIRTWLNSEKANVVYENGQPNTQAMSEMSNGYNAEAGFLNGFTQEERDAIVPVTILTNGTETTDKVYLLASDELSLLSEADVSRFAKPTSEAVELDGSRWYTLHFNDYGVSDHYWWLRDAAADSSCECYVVTNSYVGGAPDGEPVGLEGYGIRPVMTIDLTSPAVNVQ